MPAHSRFAPQRTRQSGFSMVEMLLTAFILAIGILGLSMLQVMSLRGSRGGRSLGTAVLVAEAVMDRAEMEGRLSWLNKTDSKLANPVLSTANLKYITLVSPNGAQVDVFNIKGRIPDPTSADLAEKATFFTATTKRSQLVTGAINGNLSDFSVVVEFQDQVDKTNTPIVRSVTLTRRITHG